MQVSRLVCLALLTAIAGATVSARQSPALAEARSRFSFLPAAKCADADDVRHCETAIPKDWSAEERASIQRRLQRLTASDLAQGILVGAVENGFPGLRRYVTALKVAPGSEHTPSFSPGFVLFGSRIVGITDAYFQTEDVRDPSSDYPLGDLFLLHELIHAFDDRTHSTAAGFTARTGWALQDNQWTYTNRVSISEYSGVYAETLTLYARGRYADAWTKDRTFAMSLRVPMPTIQSLATPGESFADVLAHLILDPRARSYLKADVVQWFESHVFPLLEVKAKRFRASDFLDP